MREHGRDVRVCRDTSLSKTPVTVDYGPQIVSGSAVFLAFKLGVSDVYSKTLPTIALQKTSSQKTTAEGAFVAPKLRATSAALCLPAHLRSWLRLAGQSACTLCRHDERHGRATELEPKEEPTARAAVDIDIGRLAKQRPWQANVRLPSCCPLLERSAQRRFAIGAWNLICQLALCSHWQ